MWARKKHKDKYSKTCTKIGCATQPQRREEGCSSQPQCTGRRATIKEKFRQQARLENSVTYDSGRGKGRGKSDRMASLRAQNPGPF